MKRASYWIILLLTLFICFILGYQRSVVARSSYVLTSRKGQLIAQIEQKENDLNRLKEEVQSLTEEVASFPQVTPSTELEVKLAEQEEKLGFSELKGPGLIITLADSKQKPKPDDDPNYYIVHDWQIRNLVRFLLGVGADGVAVVNDQRIVFNSEIVCAGPIIIVNGQRLSPPYRIFVVGDPKLLQEKLESFPDLELLKALRDTYGLVFQLETSPSVSLPGRPVEVLMSAK